MRRARLLIGPGHDSHDRVVEALRNLGCEVMGPFADAADALAAASLHNPDIAILCLDDKNRRMAERLASICNPAMIFTWTQPDRAVFDRVMRFKPVAFLKIPIDLDDLLRAVSSASESRKGSPNATARSGGRRRWDHYPAPETREPHDISHADQFQGARPPDPRTPDHLVKDVKFAQYVIDHSGEAVYLCHESGKLLYANIAASQVSGFAREELSEKYVWEIDPNQSPETWKSYFEFVKRTGSAQFETRHLTRHGQEIPVEITANFMRRRSSEYLCMFVRDISVRARMTEALQAAAREWERTFDAMPLFVAILDRNCNIVRCNKYMEESLSGEMSAILGAPCFQAMHSSQDAPCECIFENAAQHVRTHSRELFLASMGRHFLVTVAPFVDGKGRMSGCIHIARDITDRKRSEKLALNAERLEAVSEVASGVAHHFNNTMQIVSGYAELAEMSLDIGDIEGARTDIERIKKGSKFAAEIVRRLQGFVHNRRGSYAPDTINLASVLQQAAEITQMWIGLKRDGEGPVVEFILDLAPDLHVHGIENDLLEVATHLMRNAVEASPNGGVVQVSAASQDDCVVFMVRDTGPGIPEEDLGRVFEPFFTTKGCTRTGLGLSSCMGIIRSHGGEISLSCPPGGGTIIHVCLPAAVKPVEK